MPFISTTLDRGLQKRIQEIGAGALRNFAYAANVWFKRDLKEFNFALMPIAFESPEGVIETVFSDNEKGATANIQKFLSSSTRSYPFDFNRPFNVGVEIELRFVRKPAIDAVPVRVDPAHPDAVPVSIREEELLRLYKWSFLDLRTALHKRYSDFKENEKFHKIRRPLELDKRFCFVRRLDPNNPKTQKQRFYSPNILAEFDRHYTRPSKVNAESQPK